jgi:hypothetical protein
VSAFANFLEVTSDVVGLFSGILLLFPSYREMRARLGLADVKRQLQEVAKKLGDGAVPELAEIQNAERRIDEVDPTDARIVWWGVICLLASFAMKLIYHAVDKNLWAAIVG